jgi:hypothetical protein
MTPNIMIPVDAMSSLVVLTMVHCCLPLAVAAVAVAAVICCYPEEPNNNEHYNKVGDIDEATLGRKVRWAKKDSRMRRASGGSGNE